ncbi:FAD-binding and (Fe-S)-binding domain-containing protein [Francisella adeliensis]|uniref:4Fe-4S ferredoxin n=1 Tax=Francisella adeliensis TaxID=2007306 RepID=A0A2Z4XZY4_9GAMM|nr:FAD-binding and (Fe-S)-binding domain-containing protein [Francisella adeliensis]AXA34208.1 4Fe-4S ferredoxin [Francisella adeliensis]MBK2084848.1 FAD-binding oxidoreductase [Francisella adeliensis]MBK2096321.1 FAD-binding oxidoreductase [Francisella adeliensis]QIW12452.1 FAD-binding oxidoreductase [Francisella adeliensis]QIW14325.1 FAD-binding oxidoreductase [Francisella adeliensis]
MKQDKLPVLNISNKLNQLIDLFINDLRQDGFRGDLHEDYASRISTSMDNSVYMVVPELVVFPRSKSDVEIVFKLASLEKYREMKFAPRGGGTGTAGHSLCAGVIVDSSRYMNQILEVNLDDEFVVVQPGVVLDQLNDKIANSEYFFAPNLSPSNRATLGGMVNTDACGKGSRIYGRTSAHILELECMLVTGHNIRTKTISVDDIQSSNLSEVEKNIYTTIEEQIVDNYYQIESEMPKLSRFLTGYNLSKTYDKPNNKINLSYLISGSEGTLAFVTEMKLKLTKKPKFKALFAVSYARFDEALKAARDLLVYEPSAIETIDNNIVRLAKEDEVYHRIKHMIEKDHSQEVAAINFIEFIGETQAIVDNKTAGLEKLLLDDNKIYHLTEDTAEMNSLWELRKKGVGLLGAMKGNRKPIPFIEDTAVAPENLADYIKDLSKLLDSYDVKYGMFGHVDVGCLHIRPALDMSDENDAKKVSEITKKVSQLVKKHGGILCAEHGHGYRSEYLKDFFGEDLYKSLGHIKQAFDPYNQLNPGKITTPANSKDNIVKVAGPFRGAIDNSVSKEMREQFSGAYNCNGNSQCLNYDYDTAICPSAKVSRNWLYSPKGRSAILREWLNQLSAKGYSTVSNDYKVGIDRLKDFKEDFSHEVYDSLDKCLGCKACVTGCPIKVDIPSMKSQFLAHYHSKYRRPATDYFVKFSESILSLNLSAPKMFNDIFNTQFVRAGLGNIIGFVDTPVISSLNLRKELSRRGAFEFDLKEMQKLTEDEKSKSVCIVQDIFTSLYDTHIVLSLYDLLTALGYRVYLAPFKVNGKPSHVKGFLKYFDKQANKATKLYNKISGIGIDMIGVDPAMTLVYRDEYKKYLKGKVEFKVKMIQEWLYEQLPNLPTVSTKYEGKINIFNHCTEKSLSPVSVDQWQKVFKHFGIEAEAVKIGCCGMSGSFGHEVKHLEASKQIYNLSWKDKIEKFGIRNSVVTGFSCRCQIKRVEGHTIKHPIELLELNYKKSQKALT